MIRKYLELVRFSHTIFALPFALLASIWAWTLEGRSAETNAMAISTWENVRWYREAVAILVCMVTARNFAMAINRYADAEFDRANPRTQSRHIPAGKLAASQVIIFATMNAILFITSTLLLLPNRWPVILSLPVLMFLAAYSYAKRFTSLVHYWLGIALMLAPLCAWLAIRGPVVDNDPFDILPALLLGLGVFFWVGGFDLIYACQDVRVDKELNLKSIPAKFGVATALRVAALSHALMLLPLISIAWTSPQLSLGWLYFAGIGLVAMLLLYEHAIVSEQRLEKINVAFFHANAVISLILLSVGVCDAVWR